MKKRLFLTLILFIGVSVMSYAQFRINQNGNISIQSTTTPLSIISINEAGEENTAIYYKGPKYSIHGIIIGGSDNWGNASEFSSKLGSYNFNVGVKCSAISTDLTAQNRGRTFGVYGSAGFATNGWNYGVFGSLSGTSNGAGVYGTSYNTENGICLGKRYAGYFQW